MDLNFNLSWIDYTIMLVYFGFVLGIGLVLAHFGSLDYAEVFAKAPELADKTIALFGSTEWSLLSVTCIC